MSTYPAPVSAPREDLDEIAVRYAQERRTLPAAQAARLRDEMIRTMLPFAGRLARRYRHGREPLEDLVQVARMGLVKSVDRYDPRRGSFTAYALATISGDVKKHFRDHTWGVHVPRRLQELALAVNRAENALTVELARRPTDAEVARRCEIAEPAVADARRSGAGYRAVSLSLPVGDSGGQLGDLFGATDPAVETVADHVTLRRLLPYVPPRERRILEERFYGERTQSEIAADLGISQMHVSRLLSRTLGWLRAAMLSDEMPPWPAGDPDSGEADPVVTTRTDPAGVVRVAVTGEVDQDNADRLRRHLLRLLDRCGAGLEIDLRGVPLLDAAGVALLLAVYEAARVRDVTVTATGMQPFVRRIAAVTGLRALLPPDERY